MNKVVVKIILIYLSPDPHFKKSYDIPLLKPKTISWVAKRYNKNCKTVYRGELYP